jgi:uncharacterized protein YggE
MKNIKVMALILSAAFISLAFIGCDQDQPAATSAGNVYVSSQQQGILVTGTGEVTVTPDLATLSLGVEAQESSVAQAQTEAAGAMNDVISVLKSQGIADNDIQTQSFSIQQVTRYDQTTQQQVVVGYRVDNMVTAKIRNLDNTGKIIDAVAQAGGNLTRINGVSFSVEDPTQYYDEARTMAVQDAQQTASRLASLSKVTLGNATYISESGQTPIPYISASVPAPSPAPQTPISPGETKITLTVQILYEIVK